MSTESNKQPAPVSCWNRAAADETAWHPMSEEEAEYCLNVLPPIYFSGGFAVSEPIRDSYSFDLHPGGQVFLAVVRWNGRPYCRELTRAAMEPEALKLKSDGGNVAGAVCWCGSREDVLPVRLTMPSGQDFKGPERRVGVCYWCRACRERAQVPTT